jgi:putative Mg2+ transporter-C (MgtC) family protein
VGDPLFAVKMVTIFLMATLFGWERQLEHKPVGFGVYGFVGCSSCALTIVALVQVPSNAMPLLGAIVTGVGFLGAGALFRQPDHISGIISAASLWTFAILGIVVGYGEFVVAGVLYLSVWIILVINRLIEFQSFGTYRKQLVVKARVFFTKDDLRTRFGLRGLVGFASEFSKEKSAFQCSVTISGRPSELNALPERLLADPDILEFSLQ